MRARVPADGGFDEEKWLREFESIHGHPLRVLHIGNIANNAYNNAKIQRVRGIVADVSCHDYYHVMGTPEWEDADFDGDVGDPHFPDWWAVDLRGWRRPRWFAQGRVSTCQRYLLARRRGYRLRSAILWRQLEAERWLRCRSNGRARILGALFGVAHAWEVPFEPRVGGAPAASSHVQAKGHYASLVRLRRSMWSARTRGAYGLRAAGGYGVAYCNLALRKSRAAFRAAHAVRHGESWRTAILMVLPRRAARLAHTPEQRRLVAHARAVAGEGQIETQEQEVLAALAFADLPLESMATRFRHLFPDRDGLDVTDITGYVSAIPRWRKLFREYDLIQAYSTDPIIPLLCGVPAYAAYEHGTLREIPFEAGERGRISALGYREATVVFITNSDVMPSVHRLGLEADRVVKLPHAFDSDKLLNFAASYGSRNEAQTDEVVIFAPARHDWVDGDPNFSKGNDVLLRGLAALGQVEPPWRLQLVAWGRDLEASRELARSLGIAERVEWLEPMPKRALWGRYLDSHVVADQFTLPAIGGVSFEAMVLGRRVVTALDPAAAECFFGERPPLRDCRTDADVAAALRSVMLDPYDSVAQGRAIQEWFLRNHSSERIVRLQVEAYARILGEHPYLPALDKPSR